MAVTKVNGETVTKKNLGREVHDTRGSNEERGADSEGQQHAGSDEPTVGSEERNAGSEEPEGDPEKQDGGSEEPGGGPTASDGGSVRGGARRKNARSSPQTAASPQRPKRTRAVKLGSFLSNRYEASEEEEAVIKGMRGERMRTKQCTPKYWLQLKASQAQSCFIY